MRATELLHDLLDDACQSIDSRLKRVLFESAETLTRCKQLSIASLGRSLSRKAKVKHNIKCIDRLFGNKTLHSKNTLFYQAMARQLIKDNRRPVIIIDWSGLTPCGAYHFLRASITTHGRSLTLYDQAYPLKSYMNNETHKQFLMTLKKIIPDVCTPIIMTDAGFRNPWFQLIRNFGWDFIGRIRNKTQYRKVNEPLWKPIKTLYLMATRQTSYVGNVFLSKSNSLNCYFYLKSQEKKNRVKRNLAGKKIQCSVSKKHEKRENEPWLLASSLSPQEISENEITMLYKKRMQIEESFRDLKNTRNGFGLRHCRSFSAERLNVALLIASLAMLVLWIIGVAAKNSNVHYSFQANTEKNRNILSNFMIGWQALMRDDIQLTKKELMTAFDIIISSAIEKAIC